ncbi:type III secretion system (T3SS) inner membrane Yop/YscD-like protein [Mycolicibacterium mucogenicum 261Sha1.1M5]|nr:type III secretion system (T3SS) inner membrane Yop/YscD-like protein [Mycolicibacterium mucogenicum 261Sha1.1M5]
MPHCDSVEGKYRGLSLDEDETGETVVSEKRNKDTEVRATEQFREDLNAMIRAQVTDLTVDELEAVQSLPSGAALLVVRRGPDLGARFLLDQDSTVAGRHPAADIFLDDVTVSRKHAEFKRRGTVFSVLDRGSLNGTYCNGERIDGEVVLEDGVEVQVGKFRFTFFASRFDLPGSF